MDPIDEIPPRTLPQLGDPFPRDVNDPMATKLKKLHRHFREFAACERDAEAALRDVTNAIDARDGVRKVARATRRLMRQQKRRQKAMYNLWNTTATLIGNLQLKSVAVPLAQHSKRHRRDS